MEYVHFPLYPLYKKQSPINASLNRKFRFSGKKEKRIEEDMQHRNCGYILFDAFNKLSNH